MKRMIGMYQDAGVSMCILAMVSRSIRTYGRIPHYLGKMEAIVAIRLFGSFGMCSGQLGEEHLRSRSGNEYTERRQGVNKFGQWAAAV